MQLTVENCIIRPGAWFSLQSTYNSLSHLCQGSWALCFQAENGQHVVTSDGRRDERLMLEINHLGFLGVKSSHKSASLIFQSRTSRGSQHHQLLGTAPSAFRSGALVLEDLGSVSENCWGGWIISSEGLHAVLLFSCWITSHEQHRKKHPDKTWHAEPGSSRLWDEPPVFPW